MTASKRAMCLILLLVLLGGIAAVLTPKSSQDPGKSGPGRVAPPREPPPGPGGAPPEWLARLDDAPPEVRDFLGRALEKVPDGGSGVEGYRFSSWE